MNSLASAMTQLYPEQEVALVREKAAAVAVAFQIERFATKKELTKMSQLTAECAKVFPPDFASVEPEEVLTLVGYCFCSCCSYASKTYRYIYYILILYIL